MTRQEELHLVALAQAGDRDAGDRLVRQWRHLVCRTAKDFHRTCPVVPTQDFIQEGLLGFWRAVLAYDRSWGVRLSSYAMAAARNAMCIKRKAAVSFGKVRERVGLPCDPCDHRERPVGRLEWAESRRIAHRLIGSLRPRQRMAAFLLYCGLDGPAAAEIMGISPQAVNLLKHRAAEALLKRRTA